MEEEWDYEIIIPDVPSSANHPSDDLGEKKNRHMGWGKLASYKTRWENKARVYKQSLPSFDGVKIRVKFQFYFAQSRKRDNDNFFVAMKGIIDGFFEEDDSQHLVCDFPDFLIDKENPRTIILIKLL
jgi:hypothetical protein